MTGTTATIYPHDLEELRGELEAYRNGMLQLAIDLPGPHAPRIPAVDCEDGLPALHLQETHLGVPVWICGNCVQLSVAALRPVACPGCGDRDSLNASRYRDIDLDPDGSVEELESEIAGYEHQVRRDRERRTAEALAAVATQ
jgi:hypothetical protein